MKTFEIDGTYPGQALSGIDEVGRGCLAGPVVVARVTWRPEVVAKNDWFAGLDDSKLLDQGMRERLFPQILLAAMEVRVAFLSQILIDSLNILRATLHGFELVAPAYHPDVPLLIDGNQKPPRLRYATTIIKGDLRCSAIAAAGVVAKVARDQYLMQLGKAFPEYGFELHKGYATPEHRRALEKRGPIHLHRKSFEPVASLFNEPSSHDESLLEQIKAAKGSPESLRQVYRHYESHYHYYSRAADLLAVRAFQEQGLKLLPCPCEPTPPYPLS